MKQDAASDVILVDLCLPMPACPTEGLLPEAAKADHAYVTLASNPDYLPGAEALLRSLRLTGTGADLVVMCRGLGARLIAADLLPSSVAFDRGGAAPDIADAAAPGGERYQIVSKANLIISSICVIESDDCPRPLPVTDAEVEMVKLMISAGMMAMVAGCATITRGTNDVLVVKSSPGAAQVQLSDGQSCDGTPCSFKVPRKSELNVLVTKDRCQPQQIRVTNHIAGAGGAAMAGNVLVGGLIGAGVDASSGAMRDLIPNPVEVELDCR